MTSKHTLEAIALADAVLRAAGSGLRNYSMAKTRGAIVAAAQAGIDAGRTDLLAALAYVDYAAEGVNTMNAEELAQGYPDAEITFTITGKGLAGIRAALTKARGEG